MVATDDGGRAWEIFVVESNDEYSFSLYLDGVQFGGWYPTAMEARLASKHEETTP